MKQIQLQVAFFLSRFIERPDTLFYNKLSNEYNPPVILPPQNPLPGLLFIDSPVVQAVSKNGLIFRRQTSKKRKNVRQRKTY